MEKIECIIFDWAGTTVDYGCFAPVGAFIESFSKFGIEITLSEAREPMGMLKIDHIKAILDMPRVKELWFDKYKENHNGENVSSIYNEFESILFSSLEKYTDPIPEVIKTVNLLRSSNYKIGSTTGYTKEMIDIVAKESEKKGYKPDFIVSSDRVIKGRPYPYMIEENLKNFNIDNPKYAVKVGDTLVDIEEGVNAKVWSVGVIMGSSELGLSEKEIKKIDLDDLSIKKDLVRKKMFDKGADFVIDDISHLPNLIDLINEKLERGER